MLPRLSHVVLPRLSPVVLHRLSPVLSRRHTHVRLERTHVRVLLGETGDVLLGLTARLLDLLPQTVRLLALALTARLLALLPRLPPMY